MENGGIKGWVVALQRPYYPEVYFFDSYTEARMKYEALIREEDVSGDDEFHEEELHGASVALALVERFKHIATVH